MRSCLTANLNTLYLLLSICKILNGGEPNLDLFTRQFNITTTDYYTTFCPSAISHFFNPQTINL